MSDCVRCDGTGFVASDDTLAGMIARVIQMPVGVDCPECEGTGRVESVNEREG